MPLTSTESTCTSETTPLHVNTYRHRQPNVSSRFASSNTVNSSLTATTYESSCTTLNDGPINVQDDSIEVPKSTSEQEVDDVPSKKPPLFSRIKTVATISILVVGLLICLLTLISYPIHIFEHLGGNETNVPSKLFQPGSKMATTSNKDMFDELGRYSIEDYDALPPFSDFLPVSTYK